MNAGLGLSGQYRHWFKIFLILSAITFPAGMFLSRKLPFLSYPVVYFGSLWLGIISMAFSIFIVNNILLIFFKSASFRHYSALCSFVLLGLALCYSFYNVYKGPKIKEITLNFVKKLPSQLNNFIIVHLSDLHLGRLTSNKWLNNIVLNVNMMDPDIIVITGDLIDGDIASFGEFTEILKQLKSKYGVFAVTGNHEYYAGINKFLTFAKKAGINVLKNESRLIANSIYLAGLDDDEGKRFGTTGANLELVLKNYEPNKSVILLYHRPTDFQIAAKSGVDLQLSGHTHAGQIPPMDLLVMLYYKYPVGLYFYGDSYIYTSPGTGTWGPALRLFFHSEITKITLGNK